jgi:hypothetical protein
MSESAGEIGKVVLHCQLVHLLPDCVINLGGVLIDQAGDVIVVKPLLEPNLLRVVAILDMGLEGHDGVLALEPNLVGEEDAAGYEPGDHAEHEADSDERLEVAQDASS